ncbi:MAG: DUF2628 domain-containing protein [Ruminococcaceae bacterium]|nr:DUF2628 domain-containing protein [Oscillospiraceae bacterium]
MTEEMKICPKCETECGDTERVCYRCGYSFVSAENDEEGLDKGTDERMRLFIDKNVDRYMDIYKKNKGKKVFVSWNWSAFFMQFNWMFYRGMYAKTVLLQMASYVLRVLVVILAVIIGVFGYAKNYVKVNNVESNYTIKTVEAYSEEYSRMTHKYILLDKEGKLVEGYEAILEDYWKAKDNMNSIDVWVVFGGSLAGVVASGVMVGMFGDCLYLHHVKKKMYDSEGGVSIAGCAAGYVLTGLMETVASYLLPIIGSALTLLLM